MKEEKRGIREEKEEWREIRENRRWNKHGGGGRWRGEREKCKRWT